MFGVRTIRVPPSFGENPNLENRTHCRPSSGPEILQFRETLWNQELTVGLTV